MFNPVTSHKPFLCSPLETDRKKEQKFQTSSSVVAQLGFFSIFFPLGLGIDHFILLNMLPKIYFFKSIISSSNGTGVFPLLQYGHSFCACVLKKWPNL